ncbi:hypothetical protein PROFUN_15949 [Planoprotostelium fungivorum]|uniref:Uncharacterized protein n=1 Tax=Planoprotostelium fungivorum TaxID=1890364 RepID=A0A2P6MTY8_9EUKA|nr:hypothetical protein PROFUN_15949 [Planoprotostelium fungivorum]
MYYAACLIGYKNHSWQSALPSKGHPQEQLNGLLPFASLLHKASTEHMNAYKCFAEDYQTEHKRRGFNREQPQGQDHVQDASSWIRISTQNLLAPLETFGTQFFITIQSTYSLTVDKATDDEETPKSEQRCTGVRPDLSDGWPITNFTHLVTAGSFRK